MADIFFWCSKLLWGIVSPDGLLVVAFGLGMGLWAFGRIKTARLLLTVLFGGMVFITLFPVGSWLLYPLESRYPAHPELVDIDGIVILSGAEQSLKTALWDSVNLGGAAERDLAFMALARKFPKAKLVFTGGSGSLFTQDFKATDVARRLFREQGLDLNRIIFESKSRNTWENAYFSVQQVKPMATERWVLITTGWHMPRAVGVFCQVGWDVIPYPVDFATLPGYLGTIEWDFAKHLQLLKIAIKEWVGLSAYRFTGKSC
ncbi:MAG: YdcF family protein [Methylococcales bacterium]|jgi:uncharacterized SAM-binding protein YcdF (DUF218 family)|nr:YdcF family protein [Methylococcales bacterium]